MTLYTGYIQKMMYESLLIYLPMSPLSTHFETVTDSKNSLPQF